MPRLSLPVLLLGLLLAGTACDDDSTGPDGSQRFLVQYDVTGTFGECTVFFITRRDDVAADQENEGGDSRSEDVTLPWSHAFEVTVTQRRPFNTVANAVCASGSSAEVTAAITVDGETVDEDTRSGRSVNAQTAHELSVGG
jgi:hypothetical protein